MEKEEDQGQRPNWSEAVEDLVTAGDVEAAISLLESVVSELQTSNVDTDPQLTAALADLSSLYSSKGFSLKADEIATKALLLKQQHEVSRSRPAGYAKDVKEDVDQTSLKNVTFSFRDSVDETSSKTGNLDQKRETSANALTCDGSLDDGNLDHTRDSLDKTLPGDGSLDDDWEAIADCSPNELLSSQCVHGEPELSVKDTKDQTTRRRGRGTFSYKKHELYSDELSDNSTINDADDKDASHRLEGHRELKVQYGTQHVLVLADFPPSTKTIDLERLLGNFKDSGVVIRWVNDTVALAVFRTPSVALEALHHVRCPFTVRILDQNDALLSSIPTKDLEPPRQRPKTSARTAQRLIAQGMGLKLPSTAFGSRELRKQEEERRNRIVTRQKLRDEAWGADDPS